MQRNLLNSWVFRAFIKAPEETEAQCSLLAKSGKAYGTMTEDMDALTFGTPFLV